MSRRKYLALATIGVGLIAASFAYVARPVGHIPAYDANLVRLAESDLQGYCAGETLLKTAGEGDAGIARDCRSRLADQRSDEPNLPAVERAFCQGILDSGWEGDMPTCLGILETNRLWPTYDGSVTDQWNRARPYPHRAALLGGGGGVDTGSRTGGRPADSGERSGGLDLRLGR